MEVYILSGSRTPVGSFMGSLSSVPATQLGAAAISGAIGKAGIESDSLDEVFMGHVVQAGTGQAPARQAALFAGLPNSIPCNTVNKVCGSGMRTIIMGGQSILSGDNQLVVAGGMENMSMAPHLLHSSRKGFKFGPSEIKDSMQWDGLWDVYSDRPMGNCAEECVKKYKFSRESMDEYAIRSFKRAQEAVQKGIFSAEITPVKVTKKGGESLIDSDEGPFVANFDKIPKLRPAFEKEGKITAANASTINDGAAALVIGGATYKDRAKFKIVSWAAHAQDPTWFTTAPVQAMKKCLDKSGLKLESIDLFEVNEAFAVVAMNTIVELNLDDAKVNIYGGAVSLGHPIGASGARIVVTLMNALERQNKRYGMASICIGGGEALSLIIERL
jgi:acetyl-CoA C-acetyltransferase